MKGYFVLIFCFLYMHLINGQNADQTSRIDSFLSNMSIEEKIGQVIMIRAFSHNDPEHINDVKAQVKKYKPGGICFFQGNPTKQVQLTNDYQKLSKIPMLVAIDGEWGLGMRFKDDAVSFPKQLTLGAISDHNIIYSMGKEIARQMLRIGIHVNFAPVVDVNNNAANPVINIRSFGENADNVTSKAYAYMKGMQDGGLSVSLKHFPGHGDTGVDSHYDLPVLKHSKKRMDSIELVPFRSLIASGADGVMVAHLNMPVYDDRPNRPTTLSANVIKGLLQTDLNFKGIVYSDAMEMKGVTKHFKDGEAEYEAFMAGNDFIVLPEDLDKAFKFLLEKYNDGLLTEQRLDFSVRKILREKAKFGLLDGFEELDEKGVDKDINNIHSEVIKHRIFEQSLTLVQNNNVLPIMELKGETFGSISLGSEKETVFQKRLDYYVNCENYQLPKSANAEDYKEKSILLANKDYVLIGVHDMSRYSSKKFGINTLQRRFIEELSKKTKVILVLFGSPYSAAYFEQVDCLMVAYEEDPIAQDIAAQSIFGALDIMGRLPVTASAKFQYGHGILLPSIKRLGFSIPERVGLNSDTLAMIRTLMGEMIAEKAAPGAQILIAKDNKVIFDKSFGFLTYEKKKPVNRKTIYDVASITKILASTISAMHLSEHSSFSFQDSIAQHIAEEDTTNKSGMVYEDIMAHVAGLMAWIPFYENTLATNSPKAPSDDYYRKVLADSFSVEVTNNLYLRDDYPDTIWRKVFSSHLRSDEHYSANKYRYSDLAFYLLNWTVENKTMMQVDEYAKEHFYAPLGLRYTGFNPLYDHPISQIAPTERDNYFRMQTIRGFVHDMGAAMLGGISGHAGLFSNSLEVGILMQMLLNKGVYGDQRYLQEETIDYCTTRHEDSSRRGIGFDMKELDLDKTQNMSELASEEAFGHLGFTGCAAFADPEYDIVYVFLSNRTYPSMKNNRFGRNNYRPKVQSIIYKALIN